MTQIHNLGFPRIGQKRELKFALEAYWRGDADAAALEQTARELRRRHWQRQADAGLDLIPVGDFSYYDQVLDLSAMLGVVPSRFGWAGGDVDLDTYFRMARGRAPTGEPAAACEMTKWFDTNYHYLVPEFEAGQRFSLSSHKLFREVAEAQDLGHTVKPVLVGPLTYLWLGKCKTPGLHRLDLIDALVPIYQDILTRLATLGVEWVQLDEPILSLDLPQPWQAAFESVYNQLQAAPPKILLTNYFGPMKDNLSVASKLPVAGLHVDGVRGGGEINSLIDWLPNYRVLSVGVVDGRNVWRCDLSTRFAQLKDWQSRLGDRLWVAPSCSLLHVPVDLAGEDKLPDSIDEWLAFACQKLDEVVTLGRGLRDGEAAIHDQLAASDQAHAARRNSPQVRNPAVRGRLRTITPAQLERSRPFHERIVAQQAWLRLPRFPTTTIGSFPQTPQIRLSRRDFKTGRIDAATYKAHMQQAIAYAVAKQEALGLDVLVHGEPERNDMVEYFGEQLAGFAFTRNGWVQSYGSRCVKPPIIFGDVSRPTPMTVDWTRHAQSLTSKPMKGMLTGPVTMLNWSFVRDDQPRADTCRQIALAIRDEVLDLERAGIHVIQIDEAALREGLPLRHADWKAYLQWAVICFRLTAAGVSDRTQIHTHMCYSEFNDIIQAVAEMDADVITIETSRSDMELLDAFENFRYPNDIGPGVYDIHSPNVPTVDDMTDLLQKAATRIPVERLWVNPDCGLKTRGWPEVEASLARMVAAARQLRAQHIQPTGAQRA